MITQKENGERTQHTPGPWTAREGRSDVWIIEAPGSKSGLTVQVATVYETTVLVDETERRESDARLIAAAPTLLTERQQISAKLGAMEWSSAEHAEQLLKEFIEEFHYSEAVAKATGIARFDKAVEAMAEGRAS